MGSCLTNSDKTVKCGKKTMVFGGSVNAPTVRCLVEGISRVLSNM